MTNTVDRAADIIEDLTDEPHLYPDGGLPDAAAQALADDGLLAPEPRIIRTADELAALDPDTLLLDADDPWHEARMSASELMEDYTLDAEGIFPLAVIATGDHVRAARQALKEAGE